MNRSKKHSSIKKKLFISAAAVIALGGVLFGYDLARSIPSPERLGDRAVAQSTKILDRTGKVVLYEIHGEEKRTVIPFREIPAYVKQATLVGEDRSFYSHIGLDGRGILRALFTNISRGDITQGGSTITQQLIKNSVLTGERTLARKIKEAVLALLVERKYSKDEIFELYLNQIPYGANAYGIESAAQTYFAKSAKEVTLAEAAVLSALPKAPTYYSPYGSHKEELFARKNWILDRMAEDGFVSKKEAEDAKKPELSFAPPKQNFRAPHFSLWVREYLTEKYGEEFIEQGGLRIITTLDWKLQEEAESAVRDGARENESRVQAFNASLVALDPQSGEILAMVGSRDYWADPLPKGCTPGKNCKFDPHVNVALRPRQPGSAFKPFVYATALSKGYTPQTVLFDVPTEFNPGCSPDGIPELGIDPKSCYHPHNYDGKYRGPVTIRQSLAQSLNVPSVKLLYLAGVKSSIETAKNLNISTLQDPDRYGLTLVLGGAEVTLLEMTAAYGAFAQDGIFHPYSAILRVENSRGVTIEEKKSVSIPALDTRVARTMNDILSDNAARVPVFSPQSSLYFPDRRVAAKTGTTQDFRDAWVIGYTPSLVVGVWAGNSDNSEMGNAAASVVVAGPLWHKFMESSLSKRPPEDFIPAESYIPQKPALRGIYRSGLPIKIDKISKKLATEYTPPELVEEIGSGNAQSILSFVSRDDPMGDPPSNSYGDPQFVNWQAGIERWIRSNSFPQPPAPTDYDDLHTPEKRPKIEFLDDQNVAGNLSGISAKVVSVFPLREVTLFVDDELAESKIAPILSDTVRFSLREPLPPGEYRIKITAYDTVGNRESLEREIRVTE